jgi:hypothetical protein
MMTISTHRYAGHKLDQGLSVMDMELGHTHVTRLIKTLHTLPNPPFRQPTVIDRNNFIEFPLSRVRFDFQVFAVSGSHLCVFEKRGRPNGREVGWVFGGWWGTGCANYLVCRR